MENCKNGNMEKLDIWKNGNLKKQKFGKIKIGQIEILEKCKVEMKIWIN